MRITKEKKWIILFVISFIMCLFVETYDFSKAPIVYYFAYFFFIEIILGNVKSFKKILAYASVIVLSVMILYLTVAKYKGNFISLSNKDVTLIILS